MTKKLPNCVCEGHDHGFSGFSPQKSPGRCVFDFCDCSLRKRKLPSEIIHDKIKSDRGLEDFDGVHISAEYYMDMGLWFLDKYIGPVEVKDE